MFSLETPRKEWLAVNTFGQRAAGSNLREVVGMHLTPVGGGNAIYVKAFVVPENLEKSERASGISAWELPSFGKHMAL